MSKRIFFIQQCELFWDPPCTDLMKLKSVVDDSVGGTMTNLHTTCHFINNHLSKRNMSHAVSILPSIMALNRHPAPSSFKHLNYYFLIF